MIDRQRFIDIMSRAGLLEGRAEEDVHEFWDQAVAVAEDMHPKLPSPGWFRPKKRLACFYAACEMLQNRIAQGELFPDVAVFVLNILRLSDTGFARAMGTFEDLVAERHLTRGELADVPGGVFAAAYARMLYASF